MVDRLFVYSGEVSYSMSAFIPDVLYVLSKQPKNWTKERVNEWISNPLIDSLIRWSIKMHLFTAFKAFISLALLYSNVSPIEAEDEASVESNGWPLL